MFLHEYKARVRVVSLASWAGPRHNVFKILKKRVAMHEQFTSFKKSRGKLECHIYEMLLIKDRRQILNTQSDSIRAKLIFLAHTI